MTEKEIVDAAFQCGYNDEVGVHAMLNPDFEALFDGVIVNPPKPLLHRPLDMIEAYSRGQKARVIDEAEKILSEN